ncbi:MAG TPA: adenine phosphoribosyltransferase [Chthoniobacteraceae bacterium]|nr:adenine phosphoribosyltransferase [Chthoniobacteraceae bacterium]
MSPDDLQRLRDAVRDVPDFPKPGILFKDITPILGDGALFRIAIGALAEAAGAGKPDKIAGIDARGFILGGAVAHELGLGFVPIRKKGKLPWQCEAVSYALEYGEAVVEVHIDAVKRGERVVLIDDLLATGGTAAAAGQLLQLLGGELIGTLFLIELGFLEGRKKLGAAPVQALMTF